MWNISELLNSKTTLESKNIIPQKFKIKVIFWKIFSASRNEQIRVHPKNLK